MGYKSRWDKRMIELQEMTFAAEENQTGGGEMKLKCLQSELGRDWRNAMTHEECREGLCFCKKNL